MTSSSVLVGVHAQIAMLGAMTNMSSTPKSKFPTPVAYAYAGCFTIAQAVYHVVVGDAYCSIVTMPMSVQWLAIFLALQVLITGATTGMLARPPMVSDHIYHIQRPADYCTGLQGFMVFAHGFTVFMVFSVTSESYRKLW